MQLHVAELLCQAFPCSFVDLFRYSVSTTSTLFATAYPEAPPQVLEELRALHDRTFVEIRLTDGHTVAGQILSVSASTVSLQIGKNGPTRELAADQIKSFRMHKKSHWLLWTIIGGTLVVFVVLVVIAGGPGLPPAH